MKNHIHIHSDTNMCTQKKSNLMKERWESVILKPAFSLHIQQTKDNHVSLGGVP